MHGDGDSPGRRVLIEAAASCFGDSGYERVTETAIAERAGVPLAEFCKHFSSRDEAFHAVAAGVFETFLDQRIPLTSAADPREVLAAATAAFIETIFTSGRLFTMIEARAAVDPVVGEQLADAHARMLRRYTRFIEVLGEAGVAAPCAEPTRLARKLSDAQWSGAARLIDASADEQRKFVVEMIAACERFIGFGEAACPAVREAS